MSNELLSPDQIKDIQSFEDKRSFLKEYLSRAKHVKTPIEQTDQKDNFTVAKFEYMNEMMDDFHPRRTTKVIYESYDAPSGTYTFTVEVTDLETGECRAGTAVHPMIMYEAGSDQIKSPKKIRQLMSNAKKAALTEAIRDAYAHFGIAADLYGMWFAQPMTDAQKGCFELLKDKVYSVESSDVDKLRKMIEWFEKQYTIGMKCNAENAEEFLTDLETTINDLIIKLKE